jgi:hypothetical protein
VSIGHFIAADMEIVVVLSWYRVKEKVYGPYPP